MRPESISHTSLVFLGVGEGSISKVVGPYGLGEINERGKMLINFCRQPDLVEVNTWFKKRKTNQ